MSIDAPGLQSTSSDAGPLPCSAAGSAAAPRSPAPPRQWWRWHASTRIITLLVSLGLLLPNVSGFRNAYDGVRNCWTNRYGWPWTFQVREEQFSETLRDQLWILAPREHLIEFRWLAFVGNLVTCGMFVAGVATAFEYRRRRRTRFVQFTIRELALAILLLAAILGLGRSRYIEYARASQWLKMHNVWSMQSDSGLPNAMRALAPDARIRDEIAFIPGDNIIELHVQGRELPEPSLAGIEQFHELQHLTTRWVNLTDADLACIGKLHDLESLTLLFSCGHGPDLTPLARLPRLCRLSIVMAKVDATAIQTIASLSALESLQLRSVYLDDGDLASIARLRKLQYLEVGNNEITDNGVEHLRGLTELRYLDIGSTEVTDSGLAHLVGLRSLRYLSVLDTHVTAVGVERLQSELPNLKIAWNPEFVRVESTNDDPTAVSPD